MNTLEDKGFVNDSLYEHIVLRKISHWCITLNRSHTAWSHTVCSSGSLKNHLLKDSLVNQKCFWNLEIALTLYQV